MYEAVQIVGDKGAQVAAWRAAVQKVYNRMALLQPEVVIVSLGLDGLALDTSVSPPGVGKLDMGDYLWAMRLFKSLGGKIIVIVEGGYALNGLGTSPFARTHLEVVSRLACLCPLWGHS